VGAGDRTELRINLPCALARAHLLEQAGTSGHPLSQGSDAWNRQHAGYPDPRNAAKLARELTSDERGWHGGVRPHSPDGVLVKRLGLENYQRATRI
jgi:hypothetical protein